MLDKVCERMVSGRSRMVPILVAFLYFSESEVTIQGKVAFEPMMLCRIQQTLFSYGDEWEDKPPTSGYISACLMGRGTGYSF